VHIRIHISPFTQKGSKPINFNIKLANRLHVNDHEYIAKELENSILKPHSSHLSISN
jgi:hypothetical protein